MANWDILKRAISDVIKTNGNQEITGQFLQQVLLNIVTIVGANATFAGIATPTTNPGTPDGPVFWLASKSGTFVNFDNLQIIDEAAILKWSDGVWIKLSTGLTLLDTTRSIQKKITDISTEITDDSNEAMDFYDNSRANRIHHIGSNGADFTNLTTGSKRVVTEDEISDLPSKESIAELQEKTEHLSRKTTDISTEITDDSNEAITLTTNNKRKITSISINYSDVSEEGQSWNSDDFDETTGVGEQYAKITQRGISAKGFFDLSGNPITSSFPCKIVDINGKGDFTSIRSAINATGDGDTIFIMPGIYKEHIDMYNKERHLVGLSKESVIVETHDGLRANNPCNANVGSIENMTFIAYIDEAPEDYWDLPHINRSTYGIHIDTRYKSTDRHKILIKNCRCISYVHAGIGIGIRFNQTIELVNCEFISYTGDVNHPNNNGGFIMHNDDFYPSSSGAKMILSDCKFEGETTALGISSLNNNALCEITFVKNFCYSRQNGIINAINNPVNHMWGTDISLSVLSFGNNIKELNY